MCAKVRHEFIVVAFGEMFAGTLFHAVTTTSVPVGLSSVHLIN